MVDSVQAGDGVYDLPIQSGHVGARILDIISGALYSNVYDIIREYIQNAVDALAREVQIEVLPSEIRILDRGVGMELTGLDKARGVAVSPKWGTGRVGFRGIGLYSSYSVCDSAEVTTRPASGDGVYTLRLDFAGMRRSIGTPSPGASASLMEVLAEHTSIRGAQVPRELDEASSFTLVRLLNPQARFRARMADTAELRKYLASAVPLDYPDNFEHAPFVRTAVEDEVESIRLVRVSVTSPQQERMVLWQYAPKNVLRPFTRMLGDPERPVGFLWAALNRERGKISLVPARGFQLRLKGFGIGDRHHLMNLWPRIGSRTQYDWLTGEVYVLDPSVSPTADRGDLEESDAKHHLLELIAAEFSNIARAVERRRQALVDIDNGAKKSDPEKIAAGRQALLKVPEAFGAVPAYSFAELLDEDGRRILADYDANAQSQEASGGASGAGASGGTSHGSGAGGEAATSQATAGGDDHGGSADTEEPPPTVVESLMDIQLPWPEGAADVFHQLDAALHGTLTSDWYMACRRAIADHLEQWVARADFD